MRTEEKLNVARNIISLAVASSLLGCTLAQKAEIDAAGVDLDRANVARMQSLVPSSVPVVKRVRGAWLAPKSVSLGEDAALPAEFNNARQWPFGAAWSSPRADLRTIAERVSKITGLPVRINPDVYESNGMGPVAQALPAASAQPKADANLPPPPTRPGLSASPSMVQASAATMEMNFSGSLAEFLTRTAMHFGVNWEYKGGTIHFYRYVTKLFQVSANSGDSQFTSSLGKSSGSSTAGGSSSNGNGSNFTSSGQVIMKADFSVWKSLQEQLDSVRTPSGRITISQATGTILMRDTRDAVEAAERIIKHENSLLTQQVAIKIDIYSVTSNDKRELGVDWNIVFSKLTNLLPDYQLSLASPTSLVSPAAGSLGAAILAPITTGNSTYEKLSGSQAFLKALDGVGRVNALDTAATVTLNRNLGTLASTNQLTYLASTTPGISNISGGGSGLPGLSPGTVTTGLIANALPTVLEDGSVMLTLSIDNSVLKSLGMISTGSGATQQQIQTPEVNGFSSLPKVALKPGATLVLSGLARNTSQYDQNTLAGNVGLGGSYAGKRETVTIVILVTAQLIAGA